MASPLLRQLAGLARVAVRTAVEVAIDSDTKPDLGTDTGVPPREKTRTRESAGPRGGRRARRRMPGTPVTRGEAGADRPGSQASAKQPQYAPDADGDADPGEVVWTWVPFEEDPSQGKDRPVLVVRKDGDRLVGLMLTSKDHDRDAADEARHGRRWMDVGSGAWDRQGRPSEVRLDRVLHLSASGVRREGAALDRAMFDRVVVAAGALHGWE